jgi:hypothetical protein
MLDRGRGENAIAMNMYMRRSLELLLNDFLSILAKVKSWISARL